jgi:hypothetical protein
MRVPTAKWNWAKTGGLKLDLLRSVFFPPFADDSSSFFAALDFLR